jgi:hypothetical protein
MGDPGIFGNYQKVCMHGTHILSNPEIAGLGVILGSSY